MHQLAFCDTILERNRRTMFPTTMDGVSISVSNPLDAFFPFDPYLLNRQVVRVRASVVTIPDIAILGSRCDTYRDTWVTMRYVSRYLGHDSIRIAILGSRCDTCRDTWVTMRYVSRYLGHDSIRIAILGSRCDTYRDTWVTMRYVSRYLGHDLIRIAILGSRCDTYRDTWVTMRYVSRYLFIALVSP